MIAGQVIDAITRRGISGASVKIVQAPEKFISQTIFKAKLLSVQKLQHSQVSLARQPLEKTGNQVL